MTYVLYMNRVHKYATIHTGSCPFPGSQGGVSRKFPPTGWYVNGLETKNGAEWVGELLSRATGYQLQHCGVCKP